MQHVKNFYEKYRHGIPLIAYMIIYLTWFAWLEKTNTKNYWVIHMTVDDYIPFCEVFVIPYLLWFGYVAAVVFYLFFKDKQEYYKACGFLFTGMTIFLLISTFWPNGHDLRLASMPRDNTLTAMVQTLWKTDTSTNLWPSIHVFNSMGAHFAITHCNSLMESKWGKPVRIVSGILATSIILSTMLIKQHSVFDVMTGVALGMIMYLVIYKKEWLLAGKPQNIKGKKAPQVG